MAIVGYFSGNPPVHATKFFILGRAAWKNFNLGAIGKLWAGVGGVIGFFYWRLIADFMDKNRKKILLRNGIGNESRGLVIR